MLALYAQLAQDGRRSLMGFGLGMKILFEPPKFGKRRHRLPRDIPLALDFREIPQPELRILNTLWREGDQCFCNLKILTELQEDPLREALRGLLPEDLVENERGVTKGELIFRMKSEFRPTITGEDEGARGSESGFVFGLTELAASLFRKSDYTLA